MVPVSSFPLLRLPKDATMATLRIMNHVQLFGISFVSKKTRDLVQLLRTKPTEFTVNIENEIVISLRFSDDGTPRMICGCFQNLPNRLEFSVGYDVEDKITQYRWHFENYKWSVNEMDGNEFINHMKFIFNAGKIKVEFGSNSEQFDFESILKGRQDIKSIFLMTNNREENLRILNIMKPSQIVMIRLPSKDILVQNLDSLFLYDFEINLDTLLMMNTRNLKNLFSSTVSAKVFNQFLKLWIQGSNSQLESLKLNFSNPDGFTKEELFTGLKITENNTVRYFKASAARRTRMITGGTDIFRLDGTKATVLVKEWEFEVMCFRFELYVWHDHCVAKETDVQGTS